eukprot:4980676-Pyramimonas_sp.AAC.1
MFPQGPWQTLRANQTGPLGQQPLDMTQGPLRVLRTSTWGAQEVRTSLPRSLPCPVLFAWRPPRTLWANRMGQGEQTLPLAAHGKGY